MPVIWWNVICGRILPRAAARPAYITGYFRVSTYMEINIRCYLK